MTWRQRADRMRALPLTAVLRGSGAEPDRADPHKWHTPQGVLSVTGAKFINWHLGRGGGGAIDLVMHLHGLGFGQALEWLERHCASVAVQSVSAPPRPPLRLPPSAPEHLAQVRRYLVEQRRLPAALLDPLLSAGTLYADAHANAVFLLRTPHGQPVGAELRGTGPFAWRGMAPGSRKNLGCFAIPDAPLKACVLCESAVDALSWPTVPCPNTSAGSAKSTGSECPAKAPCNATTSGGRKRRCGRSFTNCWAWAPPPPSDCSCPQRWIWKPFSWTPPVWPPPSTTRLTGSCCGTPRAP